MTRTYTQYYGQGPRLRSRLSLKPGPVQKKKTDTKNKTNNIPKKISLSKLSIALRTKLSFKYCLD